MAATAVNAAGAGTTKEEEGEVEAVGKIAGAGAAALETGP